MKNFKFYSIFFLAIASSLFTFSSCDDDDLAVLTQEEKDLLIYMREEEKLARDVYLYMYDKYELDIFKNIASSEQKHTDKIKTLLDKYDLDDPFMSEAGAFLSSNLQQLYDDLIAQGNNSLVDALLVGATIEDVDIFDLEDSINKTSPSDILDVYEKLMCGSRNHMRAFTEQLDSNGATYTPTFISQLEYDAILNGDHEKCGK